MQKLPKVELHVHLERALRFQVARRIDADFTPQRYVRELAGLPTMPRPDQYTARRCAALGLLQSEEALRLAVKDLVQQLAEDGVIYAEIRLAPFLHTREGLSPENVVRVVVNSLDRAYHDTHIETRLILCTVQTAPEIQSETVAQLTERFWGIRVAGFGLMEDPCRAVRNSDALWSVKTHFSAFAWLTERGIPRVVDAEETVGVERLWEMVTLYVPRRIGHALPCMDDADLQLLLRFRRTHLELCPARDVQLGLIGDLREHPLEGLYRAGHLVSVSTDGRVTTPTTLSETYAALQERCDWRREEFLACNIMALESSFAPPELKAQLRKRLYQAYGVHDPRKKRRRRR